MKNEIERILEDVNGWKIDDIEDLISNLKVIVDALNEDKRFRANQN
jgi:hypothetical protein